MSKRWQYRVALLLVLLVGVGLRAAVVAVCLDRPITADAASFYVPQGRAIFAGTYTGTYAPPLVGHLIATFMHLVGHGALAERMAGFIPSILALVLTAAVTRRTFGRRASLISTLILACFPGVVLYGAEPRTEGLAVLWVVVVLGCMRVWSAATGWWWMFWCGLAIGLAGLTRAPLLLLGPVCVAWAALRYASSLRRALAPSAAAMLGACVVLCPWVVRNHRVSGEWIVVNWNGVRNLYHANRIGSDRYLTYRAIYDKSGAYDTADSIRIDAIKSEMDRMHAMQAAFFDYVRSHPFDYLCRCLNRARIIFSWDLMPLARLWRAKIVPLPSSVAIALGALHALITLALACCAAAFVLTTRRSIAIGFALIVAALALPYVLASATPNYAISLHALFIIVAGPVLRRPRATWRRLRQTRRRWAIMTVCCLGFVLFSAEWTIHVLRAGSS